MRQTCHVFLVLIFCLKLISGGKKGSYRVPLLRSKRDLRDSRGNPTENLKGRPGQGYYIATDLGTPAQRVSFELKLYVNALYVIQTFWCHRFECYAIPIRFPCPSLDFMEYLGTISVCLTSQELPSMPNELYIGNVINKRLGKLCDISPLQTNGHKIRRLIDIFSIIFYKKTVFD